MITVSSASILFARAEGEKHSDDPGDQDDRSEKPGDHVQREHADALARAVEARADSGTTVMAAAKARFIMRTFSRAMMGAASL
ncbi:MAG: hypothetical protein Q8T11_11200 [Elusimicrobiota bacterium]|nr:hypothetical protein [Elusimicrobiota bacterium]